MSPSRKRSESFERGSSGKDLSLSGTTKTFESGGSSSGGGTAAVDKTGYERTSDVLDRVKARREARALAKTEKGGKGGTGHGRKERDV